MTRRSTALLGLVVFLLAAVVGWLLRVQSGVGATRGPSSGETDAEPAPRESLTPSPGASDVPPPADESTVRHTPEAPAGAEAEAERLQAARAASVLGKLTDRAGEPVAGARIFVRHEPELGAPHDRTRRFAAHLPLDLAQPEALGCDAPRSAVSGAGGVFALGGLAPGRLALLVVHSDWAPLVRNDLLAAADGRLDLGELQLQPGRRIAARVFDARGAAVPGAALVPVLDFADADFPVIAAGANAWLSSSDNEGQLAAFTLGAGSWNLALCAAGKPLLPLELRSDERGLPARLVLPAGERLDVLLPERAPLEPPRLVRALELGRPEAEIEFELRADGYVALEGAQSRVLTLEGLEPERSYLVRSAAAGQGWDELSPWNPARQVRGDAERLELAFAPSARLALELLSPPASPPLSGLELRLTGATPATSSGFEPARGAQQARVELLGLRPLVGAGLATLELRTSSHAPLTRRLELAPDEEQAFGPLTLKALPHTLVRVIDADTGRALPGAFVRASALFAGNADGEAGPEGVLTDELGRVLLPTWGLPNTRFEVEAAGFASAEFANFPPERDDEPLLTLALERGAGVRVRVVDDAGQPLAGVRVEREEGSWSPAYAPVPRRDAGRQRARRWDLERRPDGDRVAVTDAHGLASFPHVRAGQQAFHVQRYRTPLDGEWTSVLVPPRGLLELGLVSLRRARLAARFVGAELASEPLSLSFASGPLSGAQLAALVDPDQPLPPGIDERTDARGGFALENLLPGSYALCARITGQSWRYPCELALREDARPFTIELGADTLTGTVLDAEGQPAAGAVLEARLATEIDARWRRDLLDDGHLLPAVWLRAQARRAAVTQSDAEGHFRLVVPRALPLVLWARSDGLLASAPVFVPARGASAPPSPESIELKLAPSGALGIEVLAGAGEAVLVARPRGKLREARFVTLFAGEPAGLAWLEPGTWQLYVARPPVRHAPARGPRRSELSELGLLEAELWQLQEHGQVVIVAGEPRSVSIDW